MKSSAAELDPKTPKHAFRNDIEGLRGIAVFAVVAYHSGLPGFSGGFVGVDMFFVLSGYLITGLLVGEIEQHSKLNVLNFYARRARRLLPASCLMLLVSLLLSGAILAPHELTLSARAARGAALYVSNIFFSNNAADYFSVDVETNVFLHTWSLAVEEQFYLLWPLLIIFALQYCNSSPMLRRTLAAVSLVSFAASVWLTNANPTFAFYGLPARAWEFGCGGLIAIRSFRSLLSTTVRAELFGALGLSLIAGSVVFIDKTIPFPGWISIFPVLGTMIALVAGSEQCQNRCSQFLGSAGLTKLGRLSYSWYLWHWPALIILAAVVPAPSMPAKLLAVGVALGIAAICFRFVENPIRHHPALIRRPQASLLLAGALTMLSLAGAQLAFSFSQFLQTDPEMKRIASVVDDITRLDRPKCVTYGGSDEIKSCSFGKADSPFVVVLFGDSHAVQWFNPIESISQKAGWKLVTFLKSGCPAADTYPPSERNVGTEEEACARWRNDVLTQIVKMKPAMVILGSAINKMAKTGRRLNAFDRVAADLESGLRRTLKRISDGGIAVVQFRDTPSLPINIPACLSRLARVNLFRGPGCNFAPSEVFSEAIAQVETRAASELPNVYFLDMNDKICTSTICPAIVGDMIVYRDDNHLTGRITDSLAPELGVRLDAIINTAHQTRGRS